MERHSSPDPTNRSGRTRGRISSPIEPQGSVMCECPVRQKRVCNVRGCTTLVSLYNPFPFCNSCRMNPLCKVKIPSGTPRDMDGKVHAHDCPIHHYNRNRL
jgi:hypothetical protein